MVQASRPPPLKEVRLRPRRDGTIAKTIARIPAAERDLDPFDACDYRAATRIEFDAGLRSSSALHGRERFRSGARFSRRARADSPDVHAIPAPARQMDMPNRVSGNTGPCHGYPDPCRSVMRLKPLAGSIVPGGRADFAWSGSGARRGDSSRAPR
jgi:hypothetical protein